MAHCTCIPAQTFVLTSTIKCLNVAVSGMRKGGRRGGKKQEEEVAVVTCPGQLFFVITRSTRCLSKTLIQAIKPLSKHVTMFPMLLKATLS